MSLYTPRLQSYLDEIEAYLPQCLPAKDGLRDTVVEAMAYACAAGGKGPGARRPQAPCTPVPRLGPQCCDGAP